MIVLVGLVLVGAAVSKFVSTHVFFIKSYSVILSQEFISLTIPLEIAIGVFLVFSKSTNFSRIMAIVLFSIFVCYNIILFLLGSRSCDCFGFDAIGPEKTAILDTIVVMVLCVFRPDSEWTSADKSALFSSVVFIGVFSLIFVVFSSIFGSVNVFMAKLFNKTMVTKELYVSFSGVDVPGKITLVNNCEYNIDVYELKSLCECIETDDVPFALSPWSQKQIILKFTKTSPSLKVGKFDILTSKGNVTVWVLPF